MINTKLLSHANLLVKQKDSKDLIEKLERFMELSFEERKNMGLAGRKYIEIDYDRNIIIKKYLNALEDIKTRT